MSGLGLPLSRQESGHKLMTMTKTRPERRVPAGKFKAQCLALLDRVASTGECLVVTKRGKPVARVVPLATSRSSLLGSVKFVGDIVAPPGDRWDTEA